MNYRKKVTQSEILYTYNRACHEVLSYLNRTRLPSEHIVRDAVCMWTAGLLEKKYKFKQVQGDDKHHYGTLNLISDAQDLLEPYIRRYFKVLHPSHCHRTDKCKNGGRELK